MQIADYLVHASNILLLLSYSVRDMLWLRWFAVAAAIIVIPYYLLQPTVLVAAHCVGPCLYGHQPGADCADLLGAAAGRSLARRTNAL